MLKVIEIDGKQVQLASNAATPLRYHMQFNRDYFADLLKIVKAVGGPAANSQQEVKTETETSSEGSEPEEKAETEMIDLFSLSWEDLDHLDFIPVYNIVWALAKSANGNIPDPLTWLEGFESFPLADVMEEAVELISHSISAKKKSTKHTPAKTR